MARSARKPENEISESAKQGSTKSDKAISTAAAEGRTSGKPDREFAGFQTGQFELLRSVLEKRSEASASPRAVVEEFAALWLPLHAVDLELLVPELRQAKAPEGQSHAARVRKDLLNIILADLISNERSQDGSAARLEALSDAFDAYQKAAEQEREGLGEKEGGLGRRMKDRFDRLKDRFSDLDEALGDAASGGRHAVPAGETGLEAGKHVFLTMDLLRCRKNSHLSHLPSISTWIPNPKRAIKSNRRF